MSSLQNRLSNLTAAAMLTVGAALASAQAPAASSGGSAAGNVGASRGPSAAAGQAVSGPSQPAADSVANTPLDPFTSVAPANAAAAAARVRLENSRDELSDFVRIERMLFENSNAYTQAVAAREAAYSAFDAARTAALTALDTDPEARQTRLLIEDTSRQIESHRARIAARSYPAGATPEENAHLEALVAYRLSLAQSLRKMESDALGSDPAVKQSRADLTSAQAKVDSLRREFELRLRSGEQLAVARANVRNAREMSAAASVYADQTARTADILLDYAYYVQWTSLRRPYIVSSPVLAYGYPTGGYYGAAPVTPVESTGIGYGYVPYQGQ